jgi:hypothetical protein
MEISTECKRQIVEGFIDIFTRIASKEYQKRVWVKGEGPEVDDFDDTVNDFCGECDSILENYKDFQITDKQYQLLANFRDVFDKFVTESKHYPSPYFPDSIDTPKWGKIMEMAKEVLLAFNYQKTRK